MLTTKKQRGDTLIEVMFAFSVFALVAVGSLAVMNRGIATAQQSLEITLVRAQMDAQAEAIRYIHQAYVSAYQESAFTPTGAAAEWIKMTDKITGKGVDAPSPFGQTNGVICNAFNPSTQKPFILNARTAKVQTVQPKLNPPASGSLPPFAQVIYNVNPVTGVSSVADAYGIWVEAVPATTVNATGFVDFHIRACWSGAGNGRPLTLGTIVRLYEPR